MSPAATGDTERGGGVVTSASTETIDGTDDTRLAGSPAPKWNVASSSRLRGGSLRRRRPERRPARVDEERRIPPRDLRRRATTRPCRRRPRCVRRARRAARRSRPDPQHARATGAAADQVQVVGVAVSLAASTIVFQRLRASPARRPPDRSPCPARRSAARAWKSSVGGAWSRQSRQTCIAASIVLRRLLDVERADHEVDVVRRPRRVGVDHGRAGRGATERDPGAGSFTSYAGQSDASEARIDVGGAAIVAARARITIGRAGVASGRPASPTEVSGGGDEHAKRERTRARSEESKRRVFACPLPYRADAACRAIPRKRHFPQPCAGTHAITRVRRGRWRAISSPGALREACATRSLVQVEGDGARLRCLVSVRARVAALRLWRRDRRDTFGCSRRRSRVGRNQRTHGAGSGACARSRAPSSIPPGDLARRCQPRQRAPRQHRGSAPVDAPRRRRHPRLVDVRRSAARRSRACAARAQSRLVVSEAIVCR